MMKFSKNIAGRTIEAQENMLDRAIGWFSPEAAQRRFRARVQMAIYGSYPGASTTRVGLRNWTPALTDADSDLLFDLPMLRARSEDLVRGNPIAGGAINTTVTNVVGRGLVLQSVIDRDVIGMTEEDADAWEANTEREFALCAESKNFDLSRSQTFYESQDMFFRQALVRGDVFAFRNFRRRMGAPYGLAVQIVEADRVGNPIGPEYKNRTIIGGVEKDVDGAPVAYHVANRHIASRVDRQDLKFARVEAFSNRTGRRQVLHGFRQLRPNQSRGVPFLAPVIETLKQLSRYHEAELQAAVVAGLFTVFITTPDGPGEIKIAPASNSTTNENEDKIKLSPGGIVGLNPGEGIEAPNPGRPNSAFDPFVQSLSRYIGIALEIPYEVLVKHFTASYSAARAALLEAWKFFSGRRDWLAENYCRPVYEWWMDEAVAIGRIAAPGYFEDPILRQAYLGSKWTGPAKGMINEKDEVAAAISRIESGLSTLTEETAQLTGGDWSTNHRQRVKEKKARKTDGLEEEKPAAAAPAPANDAPPPDKEEPDKTEEEAEP